MARLALSIRPKAKVLEMPARKQIEAPRTQFSFVWLGILAFCIGCWGAALYIGCLIGRYAR